MSTEAEILAAIESAFGKVPRPEHFTNYSHCEECAEHDAVSRSRDNQSLRIEDIGNAGWDPLCFTAAQGLLYLMPGLARIALSPLASGTDWYSPQLYFHLTCNGAQNRILGAATARQRQSVAQLLRHIVATRATLCEEWACREDLLAAAVLWEPCNGV